jgi:hypothetical protein
VQSLGVLQAALAAMEEAGVILVPMDMGLVIDLGNKELPNPLFTTFEMARELSRCACVSHKVNSGRMRPGL